MTIDFEALAFVIMALVAILGALGCVYARRVAHSLANDDILRRCWSNGIGSRRDVGGNSDSCLPWFGNAGGTVRSYVNSTSNTGRRC